MGERGIALTPRAGEVWSTAVPIRTPPAPGHYRLSLDVPTLALRLLPNWFRSARNAYQTSANASQSLSAAYVLEEPSSKTITSSIIDVTLQATNTGQGVWLAEAKDDRGKVRMGWRWYRENNGVPFKEGREDLQYDVFPGTSLSVQGGDQGPVGTGRVYLRAWTGLRVADVVLGSGRSSLQICRRCRRLYNAFPTVSWRQMWDVI